MAQEDVTRAMRARPSPSAPESIETRLRPHFLREHWMWTVVGRTIEPDVIDIVVEQREREIAEVVVAPICPAIDEGQRTGLGRHLSVCCQRREPNVVTPNELILRGQRR